MTRDPPLLMEVLVVKKPQECAVLELWGNHAAEDLFICASHDRPTLSWCHYNPEGELLTKLIPGAREVKGSLPDEEKEEILLGFAAGDFDALVAKESYGFGLNLQRCSATIPPS